MSTKKIAILGAGMSGVGTAILARKQGIETFVSDAGKIKDEYKQLFGENGMHWEEGRHTEEKILSADEVMKSPGIPDSSPIVQKLVLKGIPVLSELEFAKRYSRGKTICITGSNGKTTTTTLIHYIMQRAKLDVGLAGNIGSSYARQVAEGDHDWYVIETSSFQLDNMFDFRADIAVLMNITPDHLDRYDFYLQNYVDSKMRIIQNQREEDHFVYWKQDEHIDAELIKHLSCGYAPQPTLSSQRAREGHPTMCPFVDEDFERLGLEFSQMGQHNKRNALAAYMATKLAGIDEGLIRQCLKDFPGVEHRLERVVEKAGVLYINDSKATNVDACHVALVAMERPTVLIVGGLDKGNDYTTITPLVREKCVGLVYLGADNKKLHEAFDALCLPVADTHTMKDCVEACARMAKEGDTVLLSPCCASFDLFENMEDRGEQFKTLVKAL